MKAIIKTPMVEVPNFDHQTCIICYDSVGSDINL